jgi:hypothetical protein
MTYALQALHSSTFLFHKAWEVPFEIQESGQNVHSAFLRYNSITILLRLNDETG